MNKHKKVEVSIGKRKSIRKGVFWEWNPNFYKEKTPYQKIKKSKIIGYCSLILKRKKTIIIRAFFGTIEGTNI